MNAVLLVLLNCIMLVTGQFLWKIGLREVEINSFSNAIAAVFNKYIFSGLVIYMLATFYWFYILKRFDLTKVYPLQSKSYIISLFIGIFFLNENVSRNTIIGTIIIFIGVFVISYK